mmetsp:Transcript_23146/g.26796  ORF Transcript_23146/g.26796 Transcript_23146/m.26796 type:complete len:101 (+) Transcript_23146:301-603(+)
MNARNDDGKFDFDFCTIVEIAIGMKPAISIEADCDCRGDFRLGLEVDCAFNECAFGSAICGSVGINFYLVVLRWVWSKQVSVLTSMKIISRKHVFRVVSI